MVLAVIPARWASTRFPGKPLVDIGGKSMIQRVFEQTKHSVKVDEVVVATDDSRIFDHVQHFGGAVVMTRSDHPTGTDRCAEVARVFPKADMIVNVQGDEPFIQPDQIDLLIEALHTGEQEVISTLVKKIDDLEMLHNPNVVKAIFSENRNAIYFSRHPVPYVRGADPQDWLKHHTFYKHIGLYGFQREALLKVSALTPSPLERAESLEQLRWLENGFRIRVGITTHETIGIDTPNDLEKLRLSGVF